MSITIIALACFLTWFSGYRKNILLTFSASMAWFALSMWLFFSAEPLLSISEYHSQILAWVFVMLAFIPWLFQMDTEIMNEAGGKKWKSWGSPPSEAVDRREEYRKRLRGGMRR